MARITRTPLWGIGFGTLLLVGGLLALGYFQLSARSRLSRVFELSDSSSEQAIEADLSRKFVLGMSIGEVRDELERRGLRQGGGSTRYYLSTDDGIARQDINVATAIACVFDYNAGVIVFGEEFYYVWFMFDEKQRLKTMKVRRAVEDL